MYQEIEDKDTVEKMLGRLNEAICPELFVKFQPSGCFLPRNFTHQIQYIREFDVRKNDVWVVSFIKAGTTWTQEMVWLLGHDLDYEGAKINLGLRFPYFEYDSYDSANRIVKTGKDSRGLDNLKRIDQLKGPRYIKTHLPLNLLPAQIQTNEKRPKIIYVARNPKDACVSLYHHRVLTEGYKGTIDDLADEFVSDLTYFAPYWTHVKEFWERRHEPNVHFITYEEMKKDLQSVLRSTAQFLGKSYTDAEFESLAHHLSFESMQKNDAANHYEFSEYLRGLHGAARKTLFIRKGKVGSWKEELSPGSIRKLNDWIAKNKILGIWEE